MWYQVSPVFVVLPRVEGSGCVCLANPADFNRFLPAEIPTSDNQLQKKARSLEKPVVNHKGTKKIKRILEDLSHLVSSAPQPKADEPLAQEAHELLAQ
jgi:hypothetical protein